MAEALGVVGVISSIVQIVDFSSRILTRLDEYQSQLGSLPEVFRHISIELPVMLDALQQTQSAIDAGAIREESTTVLLPAIEGCRVQVNKLNDIILLALPKQNDSWAKRGGKAFRSLRYDAKVERITSVIRGYIQTLTYHATSSSGHPTTTTSATPSSNVPFRRDPHFVDCHILAPIFERMEQPASRLALVGLGGVGKSQLAVEYSYRVREKNPSTWVFWVHAGTVERFIESYRRIAERIKLPKRDVPDTDIALLVHNWLCEEANGNWLMIIDNADDIDVFAPKAGGIPSILNYIPQSPNGSILITSRSRDCAFRLTGDYGSIIKINPMDRAHAVLLLQQLLDIQDEQTKASREDAEALVENLDCMPLAISQAAAYIIQRAPRASVASFLQELRNGDKGRSKLLQLDLGDIRRDGTASNSVITTCHISLELIRRETPSAARLLSLMSLFSRQGVPEYLLLQYYEDFDLDTNFDDDLNTLLDFSLIAQNTDGENFQMHRLTQFSVRKWLELQGELSTYTEEYITFMYNNYPDINQDMTRCQLLFPHAQATLSYRPDSNGALLNWASLLTRAMAFAIDAGYYQSAQDMGHCALNARESILGKDHLNTLSTVRLLGRALHDGGRYREAEFMTRRALEGRVKELGEDDDLTLAELDNLAINLLEQGKYQEAEGMHRKAHEARERRYGSDHQVTVLAVGKLAHSLADQGEYQEAESLYRKANEAKEAAFGYNDSSLIDTMRGLASALMKQGKLAEAEATHIRAIEISKSWFGAEHPRTLLCNIDAGVVLAEGKKYEEAEALYRNALQSLIKVLGEEHPITLGTYSRLGAVLNLQERFSEAEALHRKARDLRLQILGKDHPGTLTSMYHLARSLKGLGRDQEAIPLMMQCLHGSRRAYIPSNPEIKKVLDILREWGQYPTSDGNDDRQDDSKEWGYSDDETMISDGGSPRDTTRNEDHRDAVQHGQEQEKLMQDKRDSEHVVQNEEPVTPSFVTSARTHQRRAWLLASILLSILVAFCSLILPYIWVEA